MKKSPIASAAATHRRRLQVEGEYSHAEFNARVARILWDVARTDRGVSDLADALRAEMPNATDDELRAEIAERVA